MDFYSLAPFFICAAIVIGMILCFRWGGEGMCPCMYAGRRRKTPFDILDQRYACGEIDKTEFEERYRVLSGRPVETAENKSAAAFQKEITP